MWQQSQQLFTRLGPTIGVGLFCSRLLSEVLPQLFGQNLALVSIFAFLSIVVFHITLRRFAFDKTWPLLFLFFYIFYPEPNPITAVFTLLLVIAIYGLGKRRKFILQNNAWFSVVYSRKPQRIHRSFFKKLSAVYLTHKWPFSKAIPILLTAVAFSFLYTLTLATDILPADNGEFQLIVSNLGVAHPPGFSLYTLLAHLMTRLPLATSPAYKVNLFSMFTSVLTLIFVYLTIFQLTKRHSAGVTAVITLGTATTFWAQATTANIRSLTGLFAAMMIYTLVQFKEKKENREQKTQKPNPEDIWLIFFALALGFGITHHASLLFMGVVFLIFIILVEPDFLKQPKRWLRPFLAGLLGLLPLLYFPLRAGATVRGASPGLATINGFLNHVLALGFRGDFFAFTKPTELWQRFGVMGNVLTFQFSPWLLVGMGIGLVLILWRDRKLAFLLGGSAALHTFITATYRAPQTVEYMLPTYVSLAIILGYGIGELAKWPSGKITAVIPAFMFVAALHQGWQHYPSYAFLHKDTSTHDYTQHLLEHAPNDAIILADWHWATPLWYLQEVEGQRPDVTVRFVFPEGEPYADTWARRIGEELGNGRPVIATHIDEPAYANLPPPEPFGDAILFRQRPRWTIPDGFHSLDLSLGDSIRILGYQLAATSIEIGQEAVLTIAWQPATSNQQPVSLFAHLVSHDGRIFAQDDLHVHPQLEPDSITLTQFRLTPRLGAVPGDFAVMLGTPENAQNRISIATLLVTTMSQPPFTQNPVYRTVPGGRPLLRLIGYDWDNTLPDRPRLYLHWQTEQGYQTEIRDDINPDGFTLPTFFGSWGILRNNQQLTINNHQIYVPLGQGIIWAGPTFKHTPVSKLQSLTLSQTFNSSQPITRDLVISLRLIGYEVDGYQWAWNDQNDSIPALGAIPTLKWITGSKVRSPHTLVVDRIAQPGQTIGATLRVYDAFTNRPLPILDERITNELQLPWVPLGQTTFTPN